MTKRQQEEIAKRDKAFNDVMKDEGFKIFFAKELTRQMLFNTKSTSGGADAFTKYTKDQIVQWLQSPSGNEKNLRNASIYMYLSSMHYQRLIIFYSSMLFWKYVISPVQFEEVVDKDMDSFKRNYYKAANSLETMNLPDMMRIILTSVLREGIYYGVRWFDKNTSFLQKINPDICKIAFVQDGVFLYKVDMSKIKKDELWKYPKQFATMHAAYEKDKERWQEVPSEISICLKADASIVEYSIPPFAAVMPQLYKIADAEARAEVSADMDNYKMITGQVPTDADGNPLIGYDLVEKYYRQIAGSLGANVGLALSPFKMDSFNFEKSGKTADIDTVQRTVANYWQTAGTPGLLHGISNNTAGVMKLAIKSDESYLFGIMDQAARMINRILKQEVSGKYRFKITFLPITIFNSEEMIARYKEASSFGLAKSYYAAAVGVPQFDIGGLSCVEDKILKLDEILKPLKNTYNTGKEEDAGRPASKEEDLDDEGEKTRDNDTNSNR